MRVIFFLLFLSLVFVATSLGGLKDVDSLIFESCGGLENCENEGRILNLQERPVNEIVYRMCGEHTDIVERIFCFQESYKNISALGLGDIVRGYEFEFSPPALRSYYRFVERSCLEMSSLEERSGNSRIAECWVYYSLNLKTELARILDELKNGIRKIFF